MERASVGSDLPAMPPILRHKAGYGRVDFLDAGEMAAVTREGVEYRDLEGNHPDKQLWEVSSEEVIIDKGGYRHFMLKEIIQQPQAMAR